MILPRDFWYKGIFLIFLEEKPLKYIGLDR